MTTPRPVAATPADVLIAADAVAQILATTAVDRDRRGGTAKAERDAIRDSGLLALSIPVELGGGGGRWDQVMAVVRRLARVDGSLAHLFGFHHLLLATVQLFGPRPQWAPLLEATVRERWFWGNALNPRDPRTALRVADGGGFILDGSKSFCSGARDSDVLLVSAARPGDGKLAIAVIPSRRAGIDIHDDWDAMGQRQTDSGSVGFHGVAIADGELLTQPGPLGSVFASLRPCFAQLVLANVYLGLAEGAFAEARAFTRGETRPRSAATTAVPTQDPYVLHDYGTMWVDLEAARLLTDRAGDALDRAWHRGDDLTARDRGETALAVAAAKVATTRTGLDVATRMFDVMSARAAAGVARVDRYWRNLRTHTLHDPVDYKLRELGDFALNDEVPVPSFYS